MFDSPFVYCPHCGQAVLLDQTQGECAREQGCATGGCPLAEWFDGIDFRDEKREKGSPDDSGQ